MPATQHGQTYKLAGGTHGIRYYDAEGVRRRQSGFSSASKARAWYRDIIEPTLRGEQPNRKPFTLGEFVPVFLTRHGANVSDRTRKTLSDRLKPALAEFADVPLPELEQMVDELAAWASRQPERSRYMRMSALRQCLGAGVRWGYLKTNPAKAVGQNRQPTPREIRVFTPRDLQALTAEMPAAFRGIPRFAAATGLRPEEWQPLERRDIDRAKRVITVARTVSGGKVRPVAKTSRSRREVPLTVEAEAALDLMPVRMDTPLLFPAARGGIIALDTWRYRVWVPALDAGGIARPARIYDLRSTFASNALGAGVSIHSLARIMGTSVQMIELHYGTLLDGAAAELADRLDAFHNAQSHPTEETV